MISVNDPAVDAIFAEMTEGLVITEAKNAFIDYEPLTDVDLSLLYNNTRQQLLDRGELLAPTTDLGRDLGAVYHGCLLAMRKRGM